MYRLEIVAGSGKAIRTGRDMAGCNVRDDVGRLIGMHGWTGMAMVLVNYASAITVTTLGVSDQTIFFWGPKWTT
jgi:hypothetical protein